MKINFLSFIAFLCFFSYQLNAQVTGGLLHHYPFDGNWNDVAGNQNATNQGVPFSADRTNCDDRAVQISGWDNNQRLYINNNSMNLNQDFTINTWFHIDSTSSSLFQIVLTSRSSSTGTEAGGLELYIDQSNRLNCAFRRQSPFADLGFLTSGVLNGGQWYMITVKQEGLNTSLYIDGALVHTMTLPSHATTNPFWNIGAGSNNVVGINREFAGKIDDIRFYNTGLNSMQIDTLYNLALPTCPPTSSPTTLEAYYAFSGNTIDSVQGLDAINEGAVLTEDINNNCSAAYEITGWDDNQRLYINDSVVSLTQDFAINTWFYVNATNTTDPQILLSSRYNLNGSIAGGLEIYLDQSNRLNCAFRRQSPFTDLGFLTSAPLNTGTWYMLTVKQVGLHTDLFINGIPVHTMTLPSHATTSPFWSIGAVDNGNLIRELNGKIDELRFYSGAMSSSQITDLYTQTSQKGDNLLSHYPFTGNTNDIVGGHDAVNVGAVATSDVYGTPNSAYEITGWNDNQLLYINNNIIDLTEDFTINQWFHINAINTSVFQILLSSRFNSNGSIAGGIEVYLDQSNRLKCAFRRQSPFTDLGFLTSAVLNTGQWYMLTVKQEGLNTYLYINGALIHTMTLPSHATTSPFWSIGAVNNNLVGINRELNGKVDDLRFYCGAIDSTQIMALYDVMTPTKKIATITELENSRLYPNPTTNSINLELNNTNTTQVQIINPLGQVLGTEVLEGKTNYQINLKSKYNLNPGIYYIKVQSDKHQKTSPILLH